MDQGFLRHWEWVSRVTTFMPLWRCSLLFLLLAGMSKPGLGQAQTVGKWSTLSYTMPINPIHVALLNNGKILVVAGSGNCPASQPGCPWGSRMVQRITPAPCFWILPTEISLNLAFHRTCFAMAWWSCRMAARLSAAALCPTIRFMDR